MLKLIIRTFIIYIALVILMRIMGKRQLGELELSELVTTILLSEIATAPINDPDSSIWNAVIPILIISSLELILSYLLLKIPFLRQILTSRPSIIINKGRIDKREMKQSRITIDELISQIRQNGVYSIQEVDYAILEKNGKMTVIPKSKNRSPDAQTLGLSVSDSGVMRVIIADGRTDVKNLSDLGKDTCWLNNKLSISGISANDIFLMTLDDSDKIFIQTKDGNIISL